MADTSQLVQLIQTHGYALLAPLALVEGPIVSVIAGYLASLDLMALPLILLVVVAADLLGDAGFYLIGRKGRRWIPARWMARIGLSRQKLARLVRGFRANGTRFLILGKLTHSAGFAALTAAGISRMNFARFMLVNLLVTIPKSLAFVLLGYLFGAASTRIDGWIFWGSLVMLGVVALGFAIWHIRRRRARA